MVNPHASDPAGPQSAPAPHSATFPALSLDDLTRILQAGQDEPGGGSSASALQRAGFAAGEGLFREFAAGIPGKDPASLDGERFWEVLARFFERRGWGRISQSRVHPGMGLLTAWDWAETRNAETGHGRTGDGKTGHGGRGSAGCPISTGMLARVLGEVAQGPVAVLQVACPSRGDDACQFLFGHEDAVHRSYDLLREGVPLDHILEQV
ncbi:MAG: hypothetical protein EA421_09335 [Gemmatimonadales bacterium]|nr:MAG: hypothetical protein EA421_09335 [Gemmatimonadales bacterium]